MNGEAGAASLGLSLPAWLAARPGITRENEIVVDVWGFCEGWNPAALPLAVAFYGISDLDFLIEQLLVLRQAIEKHQAANRG